MKNPQTKANRRPPKYSQAELNRIFEKCDAYEKTIFATLLMTGMRDEELYFLTWADTDIVTVQKLMGHSDIETTRQYMNPDEILKRAAVMRLSLKPKE